MLKPLQCKRNTNTHTHDQKCWTFFRSGIRAMKSVTDKNPTLNIYFSPFPSLCIRILWVICGEYVRKKLVLFFHIVCCYASFVFISFSVETFSISIRLRHSLLVRIHLAVEGDYSKTMNASCSSSSIFCAVDNVYVCSSRILWRYVIGLLQPKRKPVFNFFFVHLHRFCAVFFPTLTQSECNAEWSFINVCVIRIETELSFSLSHTITINWAFYINNIRDIFHQFMANLIGISC